MFVTDNDNPGPKWSWLAIAIAFFLYLILISIILTVLMKFDSIPDVDIFLPFYNFVYFYIAAIIIEIKFWDIRKDRSSIGFIRRALVNKSWVYSAIISLLGFVLSFFIIYPLIGIIALYVSGAVVLQFLFDELSPMFMSVILMMLAVSMGRMTVAFSRSRKENKDNAV